MTWLWRGVEAPRDIPQWAYMYLVLKLKVEPDRVTSLKCVERVAVENGTVLNLIRIFDPRAAEAVTPVKDFTSLDDYSELILYEGYVEKASGEVHIAPRTAASN